MAKIKKSKKNSKKKKFEFQKSPTGIPGFDEITTGGLPKNRITLLTGNAGSGKTIMGIEFLVKGAVEFKEHGVLISLEERADDLMLNTNSLGFGLDKLIASKKIHLEFIKIDLNEIVESGKYDLEGFFLRIEQAIDKVKASRVVIDSLDTLFYSFDERILRSEFTRLFAWLKEKKVTAIITAEMGSAFITRHGLEEYVADCVVVLDHRVTNQITTRRLRIVKYRGSIHGNNEYPFSIDNGGITVFPLISEALEQKTSSKRMSSGIQQLDDMLDKKGFYVGSSILISGSSGTGKTGIAAVVANHLCEKKQYCFFCAFEEAPSQIIRNMKSIGVNLDAHVKSGHLKFYYSRPNLQNLELHFIAVKEMIRQKKPALVVIDPITNLMTEAINSDVRSMLTRFVDFLKAEQITVIFTAAITLGSIARNPSDEGISSMVDTWMMVQDIETGGERTRSLYVVKARGMSHSKEVREFIISSEGINLTPFTRSEGNIFSPKRKMMRQDSSVPVFQTDMLLEEISSNGNGQEKVKRNAKK